MGKWDGCGSMLVDSMVAHNRGGSMLIDSVVANNRGGSMFVVSSQHAEGTCRGGRVHGRVGHTNSILPLCVILERDLGSKLPYDRIVEHDDSQNTDVEHLDHCDAPHLCWYVRATFIVCWLTKR